MKSLGAATSKTSKTSSSSFFHTELINLGQNQPLKIFTLSTWTRSMCLSQNCVQNFEFMPVHTTCTGHFSASNCWSVPLWKVYCIHLCPCPWASWWSRDTWISVCYRPEANQMSAMGISWVVPIKSYWQILTAHEFSTWFIHSGEKKPCILGSLQDLSLSQSYVETIWFSISPRKYSTGNLFSVIAPSSAIS